MRCSECGGTFKRKLITYDQHWGEDDLYRFKRVPALVCSQCGSVYLESCVSEQIDTVIRSRQKPEEYQKVPVFSLQESV